MPVDYDDRDVECGYRWPPVIAGGLPDGSGQTTDHRCLLVAEHLAHRCCCEAKTSRNTPAESLAGHVEGAGDG